MTSRGYNDPAFKQGSFLILNGLTAIFTKTRDLIMATLNPYDCTVANIATFDTCSCTGTAQSDVTSLMAYTKCLPNGTLVLSITYDDVYSSSLASAYPFFKNMLGVNLVTLQTRWKFAFMARVGYPQDAILNLQPSGGNPANQTITV